MMPRIDDKIFKKIVYDVRDKNIITNHELINIFVDKITEISERVSRLEESLNEGSDSKNYCHPFIGIPGQILSDELKWTLSHPIKADDKGSDTILNEVKTFEKNHRDLGGGMPGQVLIQDDNGELKWVFIDDKEAERLQDIIDNNKVALGYLRCGSKR